ncbi:MAG TPA: NAD(P)/FAD-dependent oxidoreductase [bacterium]|nr:NAD(P)/FAD-dependent oxidoreductase [bacterium]HPR88421.1 NAD(P)/FAD-dependent oxidoreductase [bacterium]
MAIYDVIIVGAGQAGLGTSYFLTQAGHTHLVLEKGQIGESWRSQRWDSFKLNSPNFMNGLPGMSYAGPEPDGFWRRDDLVSYFEHYVSYFHLPVRTCTSVTAVECAEDPACFIVHTQNEGRTGEPLMCRSVVVASGILQAPKYDPIHSRVAGKVTELHTSQYRNAAQLPPGAVVVVGSAQSGCQIAEDLLAAGRTVYLCTSRVGRAPRRYRGRDLLEWWIEMKLLDVTYASLKDKSLSRLAQPQISGHGRYGHTISLQHLAQQGVVVLGRLIDVEEDGLILSDEAAEHVHYADGFSQQVKADIDAYIQRTGRVRPPREVDPADQPDPQAGCISSLRRLKFRDARISTIIWASGFSADFSWLRLPALDARGLPVHEGGISPVHGLYFVGFPWLHSRKSGLIYGVTEDARWIAKAITRRQERYSSHKLMRKTS